MDRFYDESSQQWLINDVVLEELDSDVQVIVECANEGDVLLLRTHQQIKPARTLKVSKSLILGSKSEDAIGGVLSVPERVRLTCPDSGQLLVSR